MITEENEYMPQDATDDSPKAVGIATPGNRAVHYTVAILGCADSQTNLPFLRMTMKQRAAENFQPVKETPLQSIGQPFVCKHTATDRFQLQHRDVVAIVSFRTRPAE